MALAGITVNISGPYADPIRAGANHEPQFYRTSAQNVAGSVPPATIVSDQLAVTTAHATTVTDQGTVAAAVATLVADGASPTQAHVTALNTAWGPLNTAITAETALQATVTSDVKTLASGNLVVSYDASVITTRHELKEALLAALRVVDGSGTLTI